MKITPESTIYKVGFVGDGKSPGEYITVNGVSVQCEGMFDLDAGISLLEAEEQARQFASETGEKIALIECVVDADGEVLDSTLSDTYFALIPGSLTTSTGLLISPTRGMLI
jgi:hypothetical protein